MFKKQVECSDCGFVGRHKGMPSLPRTAEEQKLLKDLGWYDAHEVVQQQREQMMAGNFEDRLDSSYTVFCTRHVWTEWDFGQEEVEIEKGLNSTLNTKRKCPYFFKYTPSYSPVEHRELQREAKTQKLFIIGMLLAALVGAVAAIVAQVISR